MWAHTIGNGNNNNNNNNHHHHHHNNTKKKKKKKPASKQAHIFIFQWFYLAVILFCPQFTRPLTTCQHESHSCDVSWHPKQMARVIAGKGPRRSSQVALDFDCYWSKPNLIRYIMHIPETNTRIYPKLAPTITLIPNPISKTLAREDGCKRKPPNSRSMRRKSMYCCASLGKHQVEPSGSKKKWLNAGQWINDIIVFWHNHIDIFEVEKKTLQNPDGSSKSKQFLIRDAIFNMFAYLSIV